MKGLRIKSNIKGLVFNEDTNNLEEMECRTLSSYVMSITTSYGVNCTDDYDTEIGLGDEIPDIWDKEQLVGKTIKFYSTGEISIVTEILDYDKDTKSIKIDENIKVLPRDSKWKIIIKI